ncbi:MAG: DUF3800 domain-containing protein [Anaerolineae bacterium]|jgi:hypothetical protein
MRNSGINVYCDESCHLQHDHQGSMTLGAVWCERREVKRFSAQITQTKQFHGLHAAWEIKWTKVSTAKIDLYFDLLNLFLDTPELHFRGLVASHKEALSHAEYHQSHDDWYYKMYYQMLHTVVRPGQPFEIYLDIKDSRSARKIRKLWEVLCAGNREQGVLDIRRIQIVRSHEVQLIQLADLLVGALSYRARRLDTSSAKLALASHLEGRLGRQLCATTPVTESKFNTFVWTPS